MPWHARIWVGSGAPGNVRSGLLRISRVRSELRRRWWGFRGSSWIIREWNVGSSEWLQSIIIRIQDRMFVKFWLNRRARPWIGVCNPPKNCKHSVRLHCAPCPARGFGSACLTHPIQRPSELGKVSGALDNFGMHYVMNTYIMSIFIRNWL